jgi:hypothetical protein
MIVWRAPEGSWCYFGLVYVKPHISGSDGRTHIVRKDVVSVEECRSRRRYVAENRSPEGARRDAGAINKLPIRHRLSGGVLTWKSESDPISPVEVAIP